MFYFLSFVQLLVGVIIFFPLLMVSVMGLGGGSGESLWPLAKLFSLAIFFAIMSIPFFFIYFAGYGLLYGEKYGTYSTHLSIIPLIFLIPALINKPK